MKPILVLDLAKLTTDELVALRMAGFAVPPNIYGAKSWPGDYYAIAIETKRGGILDRLGLT